MDLYSFTCLFNCYVPLNLYRIRFPFQPTTEIPPQWVLSQKLWLNKLNYLNAYSNNLFVYHRFNFSLHHSILKQMETWFVQASREPCYDLCNIQTHETPLHGGRNFHLTCELNCNRVWHSNATSVVSALPPCVPCAARQQEWVTADLSMG